MYPRTFIGRNLILLRKPFRGTSRSEARSILKIDRERKREDEDDCGRPLRTPRSYSRWSISTSKRRLGDISCQHDHNEDRDPSDENSEPNSQQPFVLCHAAKSLPSRDHINVGQVASI